jgi:hypothetical protein
VHYKIISKGEVEWISNKLLYKAVRFKIPKFYSFIYSLIKEVERLVY